jgi:hypothetical protein
MVIADVVEGFLKFRQQFFGLGGFMSEQRHALDDRRLLDIPRLRFGLMAGRPFQFRFMRSVQRI